MVTPWGCGARGGRSPGSGAHPGAGSGAERGDVEGDVATELAGLDVPDGTGGGALREEPADVADEPGRDLAESASGVRVGLDIGRGVGDRVDGRGAVGLGDGIEVEPAAGGVAD